jgi:hypothetical protein
VRRVSRIGSCAAADTDTDQLWPNGRFREYAAANHSTIDNTEAASLGSMVLHTFRRREERVVMQRHGVSNHCMAA